MIDWKLGQKRWPWDPLVVFFTVVPLWGIIIAWPTENVTQFQRKIPDFLAKSKWLTWLKLRYCASLFHSFPFAGDYTCVTSRKGHAIPEENTRLAGQKQVTDLAKYFCTLESNPARDTAKFLTHRCLRYSLKQDNKKTWFSFVWKRPSRLPNERMAFLSKTDMSIRFYLYV